MVVEGWTSWDGYGRANWLGWPFGYCYRSAFFLHLWVGRGALNGRARADGEWHWLAVGADDLHQEEEATVSSRKRFIIASNMSKDSPGDERVLLGVAAEADAFLEVVHREQVVFPQAVEDAEYDHALVVAHGWFADDDFFGGVVFLELLEEGLAELVAVHLRDVDAFGFEVEAELLGQTLLDAVDVPLVGMDFFA